MRKVPAILALLLVAACAKKTDHTTDAPDGNPPPPPPPATDRTPAVASTDPLYARVEGTSAKNDCTSDDQCKLGGCSSEVCSADDVTTTCDMPANGFPRGAACGCVNGQCIWYGAAPTSSDLPKQGAKCPDGKCAEGLTCVEYYGVAGPSGPKFTSCEIPCPKGNCPEGQSCTTIADGPGKVCRPADVQ